MLKEKNVKAFLPLTILIIQIFILNFPIVLNSSEMSAKSSEIAREKTSYSIAQAPLLTDNITADSLEVIAGNVVYSDLIRNPNFTSQNYWSYTNSTNLTAKWDSAKEKAVIHHESKPPPDFFLGYTTNLVQSETRNLYYNPQNTFTATYVHDGTAYSIQEGGSSGYYNINVEFLFNSTLQDVTQLQIGLYGRVSGDTFSWQIWDNLNSQWDLLSSISTTSYLWINSSVTQNPTQFQYKDSQGIIRLRIYDADSSDSNRNTVYFDYIAVRTNGTSGTLKEFDQIATINQTVNKDFTTKTGEEPPSIILSEGFESGSFSTNGWTADAGGGNLRVSSGAPNNGIYSAYFAGPSTSDESVLSNSLNLSRYFNITLTYFIRVYSLETNEFVALDIYDGSWHYKVRSHTGTSAYQQITVDLTDYNLIDGFKIAFRGNMSSSTGDYVYIDDIMVSGAYYFVHPVLLNFSYSTEQSVHIELLELRVQLSNSTNSFPLWNTVITQVGQTGQKISLDISNKLTSAGTYNISFTVHAQISTIYQINFTVYFDEIYLFCQNITSIYSMTINTLTSRKDGKSLTIYPVNGFLDLRFNFSVPQGNMTIPIFAQAPDLIILQIFNFTSFTWVNLTSIINPIFSWTNVSNLDYIDFLNQQTKTVILRYTNSAISSSLGFLIDLQIIQVFLYPSSLNIIKGKSTEVTPGQIVRTQVNFTAPTLDRLIKGARIVTNYTEDQYLAYEIQNGVYNITFYTDLGSPGQKVIQIIAMREGYVNGTTLINFTLSGFISELHFISGVKLVNGRYWLETNPFPNDKTKEIQIYFNSSYGSLDSALIQARLNITGKLMPFKDVGNLIGHEYDGYYNITVDTAGLHDGQIGLIDIRAVMVGYLVPRLNITFQVIKLPASYLSLETDMDNITTIEGSTIRIGASFRDLFHDHTLFNNPAEGNLTWRVDTLNGTIGHQLGSFFTIYYGEIRLSDYNITPGTYKITIETWASRDYENVKKNITLLVLPKQQVNLNFINLPSYVLAGTQFKIYINFTNSLNSPLTSTTLNFRLLYEPGPLESQEVRITNNLGIAELLIEAISVMTTIQIEVKYDGSVNFQSKTIVSPKIDIFKLNCSLKLSRLPNELVENREQQFSATLLVNGTPSFGKIVTFLFSYEGSGRIDLMTAVTDSFGVAIISQIIPSGITKLHVTVSYVGASYEASTTVEGEAPVISSLTIFWRQAWILFTILAIIIIITAFYIISKRITHFTPFQKEIQKLKEVIIKKGKPEKSKVISRETMLISIFQTELSKINISFGKKNNKVAKKWLN